MSYAAITHLKIIISQIKASIFFARFQKVGGTDDQKKDNISKMLASEIRHLKLILGELKLHDFNHNDATNYCLTADVFSENHDKIIHSVYELYEEIRDSPELTQFECSIYHMLKDDLLSTDRWSQKTNGMIINYINVMSEDELALLAVDLLKNDSGHLFHNLTGDGFLPLISYINQQRLYNLLAKFGEDIKHAAKLSNKTSHYSRIIITTNDVLFGLQLLIDYLSTQGKTIKDVLERTVSAHDVVTDVPDASNSTSGFEIAWGLLDQLFKRKNEKLFVTTSFYCAERGISQLASKATLVLDGHGGALNCTFADKKELMAKNFKTILTKLLRHDENKRIDHLILQSCTSGTLIKTIGAIYKEIHKDSAGKTRTMVLVGKNVTSDKLFEKIDKGMRSLASRIYEIVFIKLKREDVAFTFSTDLLCPDAYIGNGNRGVLKSTLLPPHTPWPKNLFEESQKNCTLLPDKNHRKAQRTGVLFEKKQCTHNDDLAGGHGLVANHAEDIATRETLFTLGSPTGVQLHISEISPSPSTASSNPSAFSTDASQTTPINRSPSFEESHTNTLSTGLGNHQ